MSGIPEYAIERLADAPDHLIWQAWTDPKIFTRWYGPNVQTIVHKMDVQPGGEGLFELKWEGNSLFQKFQYLEVTPYQKLSWIFSSTNERWETLASTVLDSWPKHLITSIKLEPISDKYLVHLAWTPLQATEEEIRCFKSARLDVDAAWNTTFNALDDVLAELKNQ